MNELIKRLEKSQAQIPRLGDLIAQVLLRKEKERDELLKLLIIYLETNPDVKIVALTEDREKCEGNPKLKFNIEIEFVCSVCQRKVREFTALVCTWSPARVEKDSICEGCEDQYRDYALDAGEDVLREKKHLEEERLQELGEKEDELRKVKKDNNSL